MKEEEADNTVPLNLESSVGGTVSTCRCMVTARDPRSLHREAFERKDVVDAADCCDWRAVLDRHPAKQDSSSGAMLESSNLQSGP